MVVKTKITIYEQLTKWMLVYHIDIQTLAATLYAQVSRNSRGVFSKEF
jgi:hypothetical protein